MEEEQTSLECDCPDTGWQEMIVMLLVVCLIVFVWIFFIGEPDIHDAIIHMLMK